MSVFSECLGCLKNQNGTLGVKNNTCPKLHSEMFCWWHMSVFRGHEHANLITDAGLWALTLILLLLPNPKAEHPCCHSTRRESLCGLICWVHWLLNYLNLISILMQETWKKWMKGPSLVKLSAYHLNFPKIWGRDSKMLIYQTGCQEINMLKSLISIWKYLKDEILISGMKDRVDKKKK